MDKETRPERALCAAGRRSHGGSGQRLAATLLVAAAAAVLGAGLGPGVAYAQDSGGACLPNMGGNCVYDVTRSFHVGDIEPWIVREDSYTGHIYVAQRAAHGLEGSELLTPAHLRQSY